MSSINPVFLLPRSLAAGAGTLAGGFVGSLTLGAGQFCTNPGVVIAIKGPSLDAFVADAASAIGAMASSTMLSPGIHAAFERAVAARNAVAGVACVASGQLGDSENQCRAALFRTDAARFVAEPSLADEIFGAAGLVVGCGGRRGDRAAAAADPGASLRPHPRQWLADRRRGLARHGAWRPVSLDHRQPVHLGGHARDRAVPASGLLPEPAGEPAAA